MMAPGTRSGRDGVGGAYLLNDLEQSSLFAQINFNLDIKDPANTGIRTTTLNVFICPSEVNPNNFIAVDSNGNPLTDASGQQVSLCIAAMSQ